ncbi:chemotaxis protein CheW [Novosphingobium huizhouense]|uniref:chemotaxis protein CheW n=1 Tax=Novosphingobium huizhouense TaxID=2866625 RepID=UPI001CD86387|nr:chemotaxis protein CheW [Novosphingobium huizhouense]
MRQRPPGPADSPPAAVPAQTIAPGPVPVPAPDFSPAPDTVAQGAFGGGLCGIFRIAGSLLALPIAAIREVTPRPAQLAPFPAQRADMIGALELRGSVIPIMDIAQLLGLGRGEGGIILILRCGGGVIGAVIDEICGVVELDAGAQSPLASVDRAAGSLASAGFIYEGRAGAVLDTDALARLPGLVVTTDHTVDRTRHAEVGEPILLFDCGGIPLGLPASAVEATVPLTRLGAPAAETPLWIGVLEHNGRRIPVVDTLRLLGLGQTGRVSESASIVLRMPDRRLVALAIDQVRDMRRVRGEETMALQQFRLGEPGMLCGLYRAERDHLLIAATACEADERLVALSMIEEEASLAAQAGDFAALGRIEPFLIALLGEAICAIPLAQVEEIIPAPVDRIELGAGGFAEALVAYRGRGVPLVDLPARLGIASAGANARQHRPIAILAEHHDHHMGFLIDGLVAVERVQLQRLAATGNGARVPAATVRLPDGRTCEVIDLSAIILAEREAAARAA